MADWLSLAVDRVRVAMKGGASRLDEGGFAGVRVGRNQVWKVFHPAKTQETYYAKFWANRRDFRRCLAGLRLAQHLAAKDDRLMAAETVVVDESGGLIVTRCMQGRSLAEIIKRAFRLDQNPLRRRAFCEQAKACVARTVEWLRLLHKQMIPRSQDLRDHTLAGVGRRVETMLERVSSKHGLISPRHAEAVHEFCESLDSLTKATPVLTYGDPSPGNLFFDGSRVGAIDFEDMGYGTPDRDEVSLDYWLAQAESHWYYRRCGVLRSMLDLSNVRSEYVILWRLERALVRVAAEGRGMAEVTSSLRDLTQWLACASQKGT